MDEAKKWKKRFTILLSVNIVVFAVLSVYLYYPIPKTELEIASNQYKTKNSSEFVVRTTKQNVNNLANAYIDKLLANSDQHYSINLDEDVALYGELPFFSSTVPLLIHFDPIVQKNGDLVLKQKSIAVGSLRLPNKKIMGYVKKYLPVPNWVVIMPDKEEVYVKVTKMDIKSNFEVGVEQFNVEENMIAFRIRVPYKTLGIDTVIEAGDKGTK
jgi:uncharacterized protein YpmS